MYYSEEAISRLSVIHTSLTESCLAFSFCLLSFFSQHIKKLIEQTNKKGNCLRSLTCLGGFSLDVNLYQVKQSKKFGKNSVPVKKTRQRRCEKNCLARKPSVLRSRVRRF